MKHPFDFGNPVVCRVLVKESPTDRGTLYWFKSRDKYLYTDEGVPVSEPLGKVRAAFLRKPVRTKIIANGRIYMVTMRQRRDGTMEYR